MVLGEDHSTNDSPTGAGEDDLHKSDGWQYLLHLRAVINFQSVNDVQDVDD